MAPGKSFELNRTCEPGRCSACTVKGANTATQSNWPPANAAAAASVLHALEVDVVFGHARLGQALEQQEVVDDAGLGGDDLPFRSLIRRDRLVADHGVVAGRVVADDDDLLLGAGGDGEDRVVERLGVHVELPAARASSDAV